MGVARSATTTEAANAVRPLSRRRARTAIAPIPRSEVTRVTPSASRGEDPIEIARDCGEYDFQRWTSLSTWSVFGYFRMPLGSTAAQTTPRIPSVTKDAADARTRRVAIS